MASRRERCGRCGASLWITPEGGAVRCSACRAINRFQRSYYDSTLTQFTGLTHQTITTSSNNNGNPNYGYGRYLPSPRPLPPRHAYGRKRAVLCGVSYRGKNYMVKGTINDVNSMKFFLVDKMGFPNESILVLTEYDTDPSRIPTKQNIRWALKWLVQGCQAGDSLVFHFSGHGSKQKDYNMDEVDGFDEALSPLDFETEGVIIDDEINSTIVRPLPPGATLHAIIDACYSETVLDLPFVCRMDRAGYYSWEDQRSTRAYKGTSGGRALCFSACGDDQLSMDTNAMAGNASTGALSYSFIQAVQNEPGLTYGRLLNAMRLQIREAKAGGSGIASLANKAIFNAEIAQEPQLSSSEKFDIYSKQFTL